MNGDETTVVEGGIETSTCGWEDLPCQKVQTAVEKGSDGYEIVLLYSEYAFDDIDLSTLAVSFIESLECSVSSISKGTDRLCGHYR